MLVCGLTELMRCLGWGFWLIGFIVDLMGCACRQFACVLVLSCLLFVCGFSLLLA